MIAALAFTEGGRETIRQIQKAYQKKHPEVDFLIWQSGKVFLGENPYGSGDDLDEAMPARDFVSAHFSEISQWIFVGAVGIAVRLIAPHVRSKDVDPAVLSVDEFGQFVIPVLSGHLGGANELAKEVAEVVGATAIVTTATDLHGVFACDTWAKKNGCAIADLREIRFVSGALLAGEKVGLDPGAFTVRGQLPKGIEIAGEEPYEVGISINLAGNRTPYSHTLNLIPRIVYLGVGCRRGTDPAQFEEFLLEEMEAAGISLLAVREIRSIDLKKEEACIVSFADKYKIPFCTYDAKHLMQTEGEFSHSELVERTTGADNVCERSAAVGRRPGSYRWLVRKTARNGMTFAALAEDWEVQFE